MMIEFIADIVCPWCYVGHRRVKRALAERPGLDATITWRMFQLNPDMPVEGISRGLYLAAKFGMGAPAMRIMHYVAQAGALDGIEFRFDLITRMPNSLDAHRLILFAQRTGQQDVLIDALFAGFFERGLDIGRRLVLLDLAEEAGLDHADATAFLTSHAGIETVLAQDRKARRLGITGIPCTIIDGSYVLAGAQESEFFRPLFDLAAQEQRSSVTLSVG
jgi:predicted DsbA family dithiol-disulfide isomerase